MNVQRSNPGGESDFLLPYLPPANIFFFTAAPGKAQLLSGKGANPPAALHPGLTIGQPPSASAWKCVIPALPSSEYSAVCGCPAATVLSKQPSPLG